MRQGIHGETVGDGVIQHTLVAVEGSSRLVGASELNFGIGDTYVTGVEEVSRRVGALLRLDDLIKEAAVDGGGRNVGRVTIVGTESGDVVAEVLLLENSSFVGETTDVDKVGQYGTLVIWGDGNVVVRDRTSRRPVLECPLNVDVSLGPSNNGGVGLGQGGNIVDGVGGVFGITLGIVEEETRDVHPHWISIVDVLQQRDKVAVKSDVASSSSAWKENDWWLCAIGEAVWNVDGRSEAVFADRIGSVARTLLWINRGGRIRVRVGGAVHLGKLAQEVGNTFGDGNGCESIGDQKSIVFDDVGRLSDLVDAGKAGDSICLIGWSSSWGDQAQRREDTG